MRFAGFSLGRAVSNTAVGLVFPIFCFVAWWVLSANSTSVFFPPLRDSVIEFADLFFGSGRKHVFISATYFLAGYLISLVLGVMVGLVIGLVPRIRADVAPVLEFARALPVVALVPAALVLFGPGARMEIAIIAFGGLWPILLNTIDGVRSVDQTMRDMTIVYGLGPYRRLFRLVLPYAMPQILSGMQTSITVGLAITIIASMFGGVNGVGFFVLYSLRLYDIPGMWAGLFVLAIFGLIAGSIMDVVERRALRWYRGWLGERAG